MEETEGRRGERREREEGEEEEEERRAVGVTLKVFMWKGNDGD